MQAKGQLEHPPKFKCCATANLVEYKKKGDALHNVEKAGLS
jgi:hypothetical protein